MTASIYSSVRVSQAASGSTLETGSVANGGVNRVAYALAGCGAGSPLACTGVKWGGSGGVAMTKISTDLNYSTYGIMNVWRLINPASSTSTFYGTWSGGVDESWIIGVHIQDADQSTPNGTVAEANGSASTATVSATSSAGLLVIDFASLLDTSGTDPYFTAGAGQTYSQIFAAGAISAYEEAASSYETAAGASTTMSHTLNDAPAPEWGVIAFAINDAAAGGGTILPMIMQHYYE